MQSVLLANGLQLVPVASEDFMWIGLMANIPDNNVLRGVINVVQSYSKLYYAQTRGQVACGLTDCIDQAAAYFRTQLR